MEHAFHQTRFGIVHLENIFLSDRYNTKEEACKVARKSLTDLS
jgi:hypothetical protein